VRAGRVGLAAGGHFAVLFAVYLVTGPLRATYLDGAVGPRTGALAEAAAFLVASLIAVAVVMPRLSRHWSTRETLAVGAGALMLFIGSDIVVAETLCGVPATRHLARFGTVPGAIQAAALAFAACAPAAWWWEGDVPAHPEPRPQRHHKAWRDRVPALRRRARARHIT
jgi:hypothetical protein